MSTRSRKRPSRGVACRSPQTRGSALGLALAALTIVSSQAAGAQPAPEPREAPAEFADEARSLMRLVACDGTAPIPEGAEAVAEAHCKQVVPAIEKYRASYAEEAKRFIAGLRPKDLPSKVVYPFGGGDLLTALTTYPDAQEITSISLELVGDPRRVKTIDKKKLEKSLTALRPLLKGLVDVEDFSRSVDLSKVQQGDLPGQLSIFLVGLAVHRLEPVSLRYFRLEPDGAIHYLTAEDIAAVEKKYAKKRKGSWTAPDFSEAFANMELGYRTRGDPSAPVRIYRHIAANLSDASLKADSALLRHLSAKGRVAALVKAASYLLWLSSFSTIRDYLLQSADFIVSESSGIPPRFAGKAGFEQVTYGEFNKAYLPDASEEISRELAKLWKSQPKRELPFRFGYPDDHRKNHLLITRRLPPGQPPGN